MAPADDTLLEWFEEEGGTLTPLAVSRDGMVERADVGRKWAGIRCREMVRYGLLEYVDDGLFRLTDAGRAYLAGELDASTLEPDEFD